MFDIPIITYHKISDQREFGLTTVSKSKFETQMEHLKSNGYNSVRLMDLNPEYRLPEKPIIITFDDGYESIYKNAIPVLNKFNFKAVIFIVTNYIGQINTWESTQFQQKFRHLSVDQIRNLRKNDHEIGSHSKLHNYLPSLNEKMLADEIEGSKAKIDRLLGEEITSFCYPYGRFNDKIIKKVKDAGYRYATSNLRIYNKKNDNPHALIRRSIYMTDSINTYNTKISSKQSLNFSHFTESIIQKGAFASIGINILRRAKSHF